MAYSGSELLSGSRSPSDSLQEEQKILNAGVRLKIKEKSGSGIAAARAIKRYVKAGKLPDEPGRKLWRVIRDVDDVAVAMWRQYRGEVKAYGPDPRLSIELIMEQEPRPDCRVVLTRDRDACLTTEMARPVDSSQLDGNWAVAIGITSVAALDTLVKVMQDATAPSSARVAAANGILDRGYGKATQHIEAEINVYDSLSYDDKLALLAALEELGIGGDDDVTRH